jgi:FAD/FMN-containing dehydrogenase
MRPVQSWNRIPQVTAKDSYVLHCRDADLSNCNFPLLAHGNGRSYGDVCLTDRGTLLLTRSLDRYIDFDPVNGILRCEPGVTMGDILSLVVPHGWFLACSPGTQFATVGGAIANDVHGKNHHQIGSFGHSVTQFELWRSDGSVFLCDAKNNSDWFRATIGGLGLTGLIRWAELKLIPINNPWMTVKSIRFSNLAEFWEVNKEAEAKSPYTVAWIDCVAKGSCKGRGIFLSADHAIDQPLPKPPSANTGMSVPLDPPFSLVNNLSLRAFNALYYRQKTYPSGQLSHFNSYFYPLDNIGNWNRIYGRKGFYQYQCVIPLEESELAIGKLLDTIAKRGEGSFLAVLKTFGDKPSVGMMSFPRPGATLALDFPNRGWKTLSLFNELDAIVREAGGALYAAKDARMSSEMFKAGYPEWEAFSTFIDPNFSSSFWERVAR